MTSPAMYDRFMDDLVQFMTRYGLVRADEIEGCAADEIAEAEEHLFIRLPAALAACYRKIGKSSGDLLLNGDGFGPAFLDEARRVATRVTSSPNSSFQLTPAMLPFMQHHGYVFLYVHLDAGDDPPVWTYMDDHQPPKIWGQSITAWLRETAINFFEGEPASAENLREQKVIWNEVGDDRAEFDRQWDLRQSVLVQLYVELEAAREALIAQVIVSDRERNTITGPLEFQRRWNEEFPQTELYASFRAQGKRIPWSWTAPAAI